MTWKTGKIVTGHDKGHYVVYVKDDQSTYPIATVYSHRWGPAIPEDDWGIKLPAKKTAQLFAAAPEMLDRLELVLRYGVDGPGIRNAIETLIAKVKGKL